ncbi:unnamed protein product [Cyclocybe aegerita]|uniref:Uncharacterized protein n=1 Tax=Cyclocybe aegerita TaxID=1973307 RepID=A0A8S0VUB1_CYCAE|nr:unnamed protein product [Cyclocybe aegerita]
MNLEAITVRCMEWYKMLRLSLEFDKSRLKPTWLPQLNIFTGARGYMGPVFSPTRTPLRALHSADSVVGSYIDEDFTASQTDVGGGLTVSTRTNFPLPEPSSIA